MSDQLLIVLPFAVLGIGIVLQLLASRLLSGRGKGWLAVISAGVSFAATIMMWPAIFGGKALDARFGFWDGPISLTFHIDGLSLLFSLMGTAIGSAILVFSIAYMEHDVAATRFYVLMQIFIAGLILVVTAADLLLMYAGWEIVGLCSFLLVGFWYTDKQAAYGARKVLVMTHMAGYGLLAAVLIVWARTGTTLWTDPKMASAFTGVVFGLMFVSAIAKSVQFPLHTWIPYAMAAPTPVSALLHAAVYVKVGVYLVARMHTFAPWPVAWQQSVVWVGTVTMVVGVLFAMVQHDAKRLLAFHTVSQIGYMMLGLGIGSPLAIAAALLHTLNHGLFKGGLFLGAGAIQHATGTRDMNRLGGLFRRMPTTGVFWLISAASIAGVPLFNGFVSKWLLYSAALSAGFAVPALIAWIVSVLTMFSFMKATSVMFFGEDGDSSAKAHESPRLMLVGSGILAAGCLVLGVAPQLAVKNLIAPALEAMGVGGPLDVSWFGFSASGGRFVFIGLALAILAVVIGLGVHKLSTRRAKTLATPAWEPVQLVSAGPAAAALPPVGGVALTVASTFTGGDPLTSAHLRASDFSEPIATGLAPFYRFGDVDRYYLVLWRFALWASGLVARASRFLERWASLVLVGLVVVLGVVAGLWSSGVVRGGPATTSGVSVWPLVIAVGLVTALLGAVLWHVERYGNKALLGVLAGVLVIAALFVNNELIRVLLTEAGAFAAVVLLFVAGAPKIARRAFLTAAIVSAACLIAAVSLLDQAPAALVVALVIVGFSVKLALVPVYLWLPAMSEKTPAPMVGLIIAVVDGVAFAELIMLRTQSAWLFQPVWLWVAIALLSAITGAAGALAQTDLKRMLAFAAVTGAAFLVLGLAIGGELGVAGASAGAVADTLSIALLFIAVAGAERDGPLLLSSRGLARRHPLAGAGFVLGSLAVLGVPFTPGFAGHWRVYTVALNFNWPVLVVLVVATILLLLTFSRVIAQVWWGGAGDEPALPADQPPLVPVLRGEPAVITTAIVTLIVAVLATGLLPGLLESWFA